MIRSSGALAVRAMIPAPPPAANDLEPSSVAYTRSITELAANGVVAPSVADPSRAVGGGVIAWAHAGDGRIVRWFAAVREGTNGVR